MPRDNATRGKPGTSLAGPVPPAPESPKASESSIVGYTAELLAAADLNHRCYWAYLNPAPSTKDDAFAKTSTGWRTVQVKKAKLYTKQDGTINMHLTRHRRRDENSITSEIIALVDIDNLRIRYIANGTPLPPELPTEPTGICQSTSTTALTAIDAGSDSSLPATERRQPARTAVQNSCNSSADRHGSDQEPTEKVEG